MANTISIGTIEAAPRCGKCGSDDLHMPEGITGQDDLTDDSFITCANCGTVTTYAALVESCEADITKNIKDSLGSVGDSPLNRKKDVKRPDPRTVMVRLLVFWDVGRVASSIVQCIRITPSLHRERSDE